MNECGFYCHEIKQSSSRRVTHFALFFLDKVPPLLESKLGLGFLAADVVGIFGVGNEQRGNTEILAALVRNMGLEKDVSIAKSLFQESTKTFFGIVR